MKKLSPAQRKVVEAIVRELLEIQEAGRYGDRTIFFHAELAHYFDSSYDDYEDLMVAWFNGRLIKAEEVMK